MHTVLIQNGTLLTMDHQQTIHSPGWLWIEDDRIDKVKAGYPPLEFIRRANRVIDASYKVVLPGFVNAHAHLSATLMRGWQDGPSELINGFASRSETFQDLLTAQEVRLACQLGLVENLRSGVTTIGHHQQVLTSPVHVDAAGEAAQRIGLRVQLARGWADRGKYGESPRDIINELTRLRYQWHQTAQGRITVACGPLRPWLCSDEMFDQTVDLARKWGLRTHLHAATTERAVNLVRQRTGLRQIEWLDSLDVLGSDTQLVHCIQVNRLEMEIIAERQAMVIHCPISEMYLAVGQIPVCSMRDQAIPVALGTDGSTAHNAHNLLETMRVAALLAKHSTGNPGTLAPSDLLEMVTVEAARFLGLEKIGRLLPGYKADISLINLHTVRTTPVHQLAYALVYQTIPSDVHTVLVNGQILLEAGTVTTIDETSLLAECRLAAQRLFDRTDGND